MLKKNDIIPLTITGMTEEGSGVGKHEGMAVFVPLTAVGDRIQARLVKVQKTYAFGILESILAPSPDRIKADCPVFSKCGGCAFRHMSYEAEKAVKEQFVTDAFRRIGKLDVPFDGILGAEPLYYRNKAQYPVAEADGKAVCGFYSRRSHRVVPFTACLLQPESFASIVDFILEYVNAHGLPAYNEGTGTGLLRHIYLRKGFHTGEIMVCFVVTKSVRVKLLPLGQAIMQTFPEVRSVVMNINGKNTNVILGDKTYTLCGADTITDTLCGNAIQLSPHSFYQVNTAQAQRLYALAADYAGLDGSETVLDLYCGAGTIGLSMAARAGKIIGVEIVPQAVENARQNARANNILNAEFICGDAGTVAAELVSRQEAPDVIIVDPPRKGCDSQTLEAIVSMAPQKLIMISCNASTAARDCAFLCANGYRAERAQAVDMFPRTGHVETVVLITRAKE